MQYVTNSPHVRSYAAQMSGKYSIFENEVGRDYVILGIGEDYPDHFIRAFTMKIKRDGTILIDDGSGEWEME